MMTLNPFELIIHVTYVTEQSTYPIAGIVEVVKTC